MPSLTLIVMAAGIGRRYGGLKQIDPVGPSGEIIIDYSIYDARRAGFDQVVFIIREEIEETFRQKIGKTIEKRMDTAYVFQKLSRVPDGFALPSERQKPWGTAHALLSCADAVKTPFAAINADDFYGRNAFESLAAHLREAKDERGFHDYAMVGYILDNTLSEHGHVARAVCKVNPEGYLIDIHERLKIQKFPDGIKYTDNGKDWIRLSEDNFVSMNMWGFTPSLFRELGIRFPLFLKAHAEDILKAEFLIPEVVGSLIREKKAGVKVLPTSEKWFGVTYPEDRRLVQAAVRRLIELGAYPKKLWN